MEYYLYVMDPLGSVAYETEVTQEGFDSYFAHCIDMDTVDIRFESGLDGTLLAVFYISEKSDFDIGFISFTNPQDFFNYLKE